MNAETQRSRAIEEAQRQVKEQKLAWDPQEGYALNYKLICQKAELKYGPAWRAVNTALLPDEYRISTDGLSRTAMAAKVASLRHKENLSWGMIATRMGIGAGLVYRLFEEATGLRATGLRIGKGGRMAQQRTDLYAGGAARKEKGSEIRSGTPVAEAVPTVKRVLGQRVAVAAKKA
jgi:hypothetical protein